MKLIHPAPNAFPFSPLAPARRAAARLACSQPLTNFMDEVKTVLRAHRRGQMNGLAPPDAFVPLPKSISGQCNSRFLSGGTKTTWFEEQLIVNNGDSGFSIGMSATFIPEMPAAVLRLVRWMCRNPAFGGR